MSVANISSGASFPTTQHQSLTGGRRERHQHPQRSLLPNYPWPNSLATDRWRVVTVANIPHRASLGQTAWLRVDGRVAMTVANIPHRALGQTASPCTGAPIDEGSS